MLKLKMMLCVMMLPLVVVGCTSAAPSVSAWSHHRLRRDNAASPRLADTAERDYFTLREADTMQNNWKEPRSILMSRWYRVAHIDGQLMQLLHNTHALPAEYKCLKWIKPSNPFTNVCWVSVLTTFSAPPQILAASTVFFCPIPETKKWWVMVSWCYCCRFVLNSKRLLSTSCNKQGQRSSE